jgi:hypothetical protein
VNDHEAIRRLLARFCQLLDERRFDEWATLFAPDATFGRQTGRPAIREAIGRSQLAATPTLFRKHVTANPVIDVDENTATAVSDLLVFERSDEDPWQIRVGRYDDRLTRLDDEWTFSARHLTWTANGLSHRPPGETS